MNYYNRHIGDYAKQTAHLSFAEDGAYNRMLDYYYSTELPLPLDRAALYRKVRARSKPEQAMIDSLLTEFFYEAADGWHKRRCDEEIEKYQNKAAANRENGTHGGRPKKPKPNPKITQSVSEQNPNETLASSQEPVASSQQSQKHDATASPVEFIFETGRKILKGAGVKGDHGSILGKVRNAIGDQEAAALLARMAATNPPISQPVEYLMAAIKPKQRGAVV